jgi:hypothetical protein
MEATATTQLHGAQAPALDADAARITTKSRLIAVSVGIGLIVTLLWSFTLVDSVIGDTVANGLLGYDAKEQTLTSVAAGIVFAFVSGLAGTFTACNVAAFSAIAPLTTSRPSTAALLRPLGWLALSASIVAGAYGFFGVLASGWLPQLSDDTVGEMPVRLIQSSVVFGVIGLVMIWMALMTLNIVPDVFRRRPLARYANARVIVMGALIGAFLIGRPFPLFHKLFEYAASTDNPLFGAAAFILQSTGNMLVMGLVFLALVRVGGGAFPRWLQRRPGRVTRFTACALLAAGTFTFAYWVIRVPAMFDVGWWPRMPWS